MAFEDLNLDFLDITEGNPDYSDIELVKHCRETEPCHLRNPDFDSWVGTKTNSDYRIEWYRLSIADQWACYTLEQLILEFKRIEEDEKEVGDIEDGYANGMNWLEIFRILREVIKLTSSPVGHVLINDDLNNFPIRYYKFLMTSWDITDDFEGVIGTEGTEMCQKLGGELDLLKALQEMIQRANDYFATINYTGLDDGDDSFPKELAPVF